MVGKEQKQIVQYRVTKPDIRRKPTADAGYPVHAQLKFEIFATNIRSKEDKNEILYSNINKAGYLEKW